MDSYNQLFLWFWTITSFVYGSIIGSFLNVCIYRMPPKLYFFDDLFYPAATGDLVGDIKELWNNLFGGIIKKSRKVRISQLSPFLYAETLWSLPIVPESAITMAHAHNFNLYREFFEDPVTIVKPRSFCPRCKKMISWWMNIPILSWVFLRGKCFHCREPISFRYPLNEMISGLLCAGLFHKYGIENFSLFIYYFILCAICIVVFYIDLDHWLILDEISIPFTLAGILGSLLIPVKFFLPAPDFFSLLFFGENPPPLLLWLLSPVKSGIYPQSMFLSLAGAFLSFAGFYSIAVIGTVLAKREAMGGGDIKFAMLMGAFLGPQKVALAFFIAVILGTLIMLPAMLFGRKTGKDQVPFGCFLTVATIITIFAGDYLVRLYLSWPGPVNY